MSSTKTTTPSTEDSDIAFYKALSIHAGTAAGVRQFIEFNLDMDQPCGVFGAAGIGKTQIVRQIAEDREMDLIILYLAHVDKEDISGFPFPDPTDNTAVLMRLKKQLPRQRSEKKGGTLLFLDEWNRGERPVVNAMFTIMEKPRRAGDLVLPDDVRIVLSGNPSDAMYTVNEAEKEPAIRRRVCWMGMICNPASWLEYAGRRKFHPAVINYIRKHKQALYDKEAHSAGKVGSNPASWEKVSIALQHADRIYGDLERAASVLRTVVPGFIGTERATDFMSEALMLDENAVPDPEDILENFQPGSEVYKKVKKLVDSKNAGASGKIGQLCSAVALTIATTKPEPVRVVNNLGEFLLVLEGDNLQKFFEELIKTMKEQDDTAGSYSSAFNRSLAQVKAYQEARKRLASRLNEVDQKLKK